MCLVELTLASDRLLSSARRLKNSSESMRMPSCAKVPNDIMQQVLRAILPAARSD